MKANDRKSEAFNFMNSYAHWSVSLNKGDPSLFMNQSNLYRKYSDKFAKMDEVKELNNDS